MIVVLVVLSLVILILKRQEYIVNGTVFGAIVLLVAYGIKISKNIEFLQLFQMLGVCILGVMGIAIFIYMKSCSWLSSACVITFLAEVVFVIGTDNAWNYQVVFLIFPLSMCVLAVCMCKNKIIKSNAVVCMCFVCTVILLVGYRYATQYVYRDANNEELKYSVNAVEYAGVLTAGERAMCLNDLDEKLDSIEGEYLLTYGDCNIPYVFTDKKPFLKKIWVDLESYSEKTFEIDLLKAIQEKGYPIILIADLDLDGKYRSESKLENLQIILNEGNYEEYYKNDYFILYVPSIKM